MPAKTMIKAIATSLGIFFALSVSAPAQTPTFEVLEGLQKGNWSLKERGAQEEGRQLCLGDPAILLQVQHSGASCSQYVIENSPSVLRVSYKCGELGHGVTEIRRESSGLIQIHSQGIADNSPFSFSAEGRRTGDC
ncbi:DUF3617 domain-containing protein [Parasphingorhabdus sp.]|uniref:DUF3617 domain-containing protein n=1 Tax=Parasphingorhabdus sp. TaxID=2709688 RepID=UPI0007F45880|nr:hypothetical protein A8B75_03255 [Sphingomonadales bacterium EhC05]